MISLQHKSKNPKVVCKLALNGKINIIGPSKEFAMIVVHHVYATGVTPTFGLSYIGNLLSSCREKKNSFNLVSNL